MIVASGLELRAGARLLLANTSFQVAEGDRIGLVGRNGAGKTTLAKVLSGNGLPAAGTAYCGARRRSIVLPTWVGTSRTENVGASDPVALPVISPSLTTPSEACEASAGPAGTRSA